MEQIKHVEENLKTRNIRHIGMDIVKSIAILSVIGVHFFLNTKFYTTNLNNFNLFFQTILQQLFLACIPLFLISTGYLNNSVDISKKYFKKLYKLNPNLKFINLYLKNINDRLSGKKREVIPIDALKDPNYSTSKFTNKTKNKLLNIVTKFKHSLAN